MNVKPMANQVLNAFWDYLRHPVWIIQTLQIEIESRYNILNACICYIHWVTYKFCMPMSIHAHIHKRYGMYTNKLEECLFYSFFLLYYLSTCVMYGHQESCMKFSHRWGCICIFTEINAFWATPLVPPWFHLLFTDLSTPCMLVHFLPWKLCFFTFHTTFDIPVIKSQTNVGFRILSLNVTSLLACGNCIRNVHYYEMWYVSMHFFNTSVLHNYLKLLSCKSKRIAKRFVCYLTSFHLNISFIIINKYMAKWYQLRERETWSIN